MLEEQQWPLRSVGAELIVLVLGVLSCCFLLPVGSIFLIAQVVRVPESLGIFAVLALMGAGGWALLPLTQRLNRAWAHRRGHFVRMDAIGLQLPGRAGVVRWEAVAQLRPAWCVVRGSVYSAGMRLSANTTVPFLVLELEGGPQGERFTLHAENDRGTAPWCARFERTDTLPETGANYLVFVDDLTEIFDRIVRIRLALDKGELLQ